MGEMSDFVGTWRAEKGAPLSIHTFTWEDTGTGLRGRWVIEAADSPAVRAAAAAGRPTRFEMQVGDPWLEDGLLLFHLNGGPYITEFRLVGFNEAVVGAAMDKLPPEFAGPEHRRSIEGHRVQLTRRAGEAVWKSRAGADGVVGTGGRSFGEGVRVARQLRPDGVEAWRRVLDSQAARILRIDSDYFEE